MLAAMRTALVTERIEVCSLAGTVHHLHLHLISRYATMPGGWGPHLVPDLFEEKWGRTVSEAEDAAHLASRGR